MHLLALLVGCGPDPKCDPNTEDACTSLSSGDDDDTPDVGNAVDLDRFPPVVVETVPASGALSVTPGTTRVEAVFSRPMTPGSWSWVSVDGNFPVAGAASFLDDGTAVLDDVVLEPNTAYQLWLNDPFGAYSNFASEGGIPAVPYPLVFATSADPTLLAGSPAAVVASDPPAGTEGVDPALDRIEVTFGRDMDPDASGWTEDTARTFPALGPEGFVDARTAYVDVTLEPGTTYAVWVEGFVDTDGTAAAPWLLTFRTEEP